MKTLASANTVMPAEACKLDEALLHNTPVNAANAVSQANIWERRCKREPARKGTAKSE